MKAVMMPGNGHIEFTGRVISIIDSMCTVQIIECDVRPQVIGIKTTLNKKCFKFVSESNAVELFYNI